MHKHGGDIYRNPGVLDFSTNCNCFGMPGAVREAAMRGVQYADAYPDPEWETLREAIAGYEGIEPWEILCGNGASELLCAVAGALQPKRALLISPGFSEYERVLAAAGAQIEWYDLSEKDAYMPGVDFLEMLRHTTASCVMLSNPNNPTGGLLAPEYLREIIEITAARGIILVADECFLDFLEVPERYSCKRYLSQYPNLILLKAFTKTYACAGLRLGYLICANEDVLCRCKERLPEWNVSLPATYAGIAAAREREWLKKTAADIRVEREWLRGELERLGLRVVAGAANFLFFTGKAGLYEHCLSHNILIRDCSNYRGLGEGTYRVCVKKREENECLLRAIRGWEEFHAGK